MLPNQSISLPPYSSSSSSPYSKHNFFSPENSHAAFATAKRKRKPAGTPDPNAQVIYLSPEKLMESDRYVCETCNLSFHREQNLQMHRRRHKVPWQPAAALKEAREGTARKRVYVCPEPRCVHHDPRHALGDLVGIKKHYRRKHSDHKEWNCEKCGKAYAVLSDYKAHRKTCGTKGHSCDCGRVFSRVEIFIEHQDSCKAKSSRKSDEATKPRVASLIKPAINLNLRADFHLPIHQVDNDTNMVTSSHHHHHNNNLEELELFPLKTTQNPIDEENEDDTPLEALRLKFEANEIMKVAMENKAMAEEKRKEAKYLVELANKEMAKARRIKEQVWLAGLTTTHLLKDCSTSRQLRCNSCNRELQ